MFDSVFSKFVENNQFKELEDIENNILGNLDNILKNQTKVVLQLLIKNKPINIKSYFYSLLKKEFNNLWKTAFSTAEKHLDSDNVAEFAENDFEERKRQNAERERNRIYEDKKDKRIPTVRNESYVVPVKQRIDTQSKETKKAGITFLEESDFGRIYLNKRNDLLVTNISKQQENQIKQATQQYFEKKETLTSEATLEKRDLTKITPNLSKEKEEDLLKKMYDAVYENPRFQDTTKQNTARSILLQGKANRPTEARIDLLRQELKAAKSKRFKTEADRLNIALKQKEFDDVKNASKVRYINLTPEQKQTLGVEKNVISDKELRALSNDLPSKKRNYSESILSRLKTITQTEFNAAYNMGRLHYLVKKGVKWVRWKRDREHIIRRVTCVKCDQRALGGFKGSGIYSIQEALTNKQLFIPLHPNCMCILVPLDKKELGALQLPEDAGKNENTFKKNIDAYWAIGGGTVLAVTMMYQIFKDSLMPSVLSKKLADEVPEIIETAKPTITKPTPVEPIIEKARELKFPLKDLTNIALEEILLELPKSLTLKEEANIKLPELSNEINLDKKLTTNNLSIKVDNIIDNLVTKVASYSLKEKLYTDSFIERLDKTDLILDSNKDITETINDLIQEKAKLKLNRTELKKNIFDSLPDNLTDLDKALYADNNPLINKLTSQNSNINKAIANLKEIKDKLNIKYKKLIEKEKEKLKANIIENINKGETLKPAQYDIFVSDYSAKHTYIESQLEQIKEFFKNKTDIKYQDFIQIKNRLEELQKELKELGKLNIKYEDKLKQLLKVKYKNIDLNNKKQIRELLKELKKNTVHKQTILNLQATLDKLVENTPTYKQKSAVKQDLYVPVKNQRGISKLEAIKAREDVLNNISLLLNEDIDLPETSRYRDIYQSKVKQSRLVFAIGEATNQYITWEKLMNSSNKDKILSRTKEYLNSEINKLIIAEFKIYEFK